jgi:hypothetical protein
MKGLSSAQHFADKATTECLSEVLWPLVSGLFINYYVSSVCICRVPYGASNGGLPISMWGWGFDRMAMGGIQPESQFSWLPGRYVIMTF